MRNVKSILVAALALTVICAAVVAALAATNNLTKGAIDEQQRAATETACREVLTAESYVLLDGEWADGVTEVYEGKNGEEVAGYVVKTSTTGKSSGLVVMTGVNADGTVSGVAVIDNAETAGYVDKVIAGGLLERLVGAEDADAVAGMSQATKTSNGIKAGVTLALETVKEVTGQ